MRTLDIPNAQPPALTFADALNSPCATCEGTPCCQNLPLQTFALSNVTDVDYALYLLNFHNIELGVAADGTWSAYYRQACRFLDPNTLGCGLHGTPDKPHVCVQYNPFSCFYRRGFSEEGSADYLRVDRERMQTIASSLVFDADRQIIAAPTLESLAEVFGAQPILDDVVPYQESPAASSESGSSQTNLTDPCGSCQAHCCTTLLFPINPPVGIGSLDYLRFALGFPGTEVVVMDREWRLAISTRCRHLQDGKCGIFGAPERPLRCQYYDAWACGYRAVFDAEGQQNTVRMRLEDFPALAQACLFNKDGTAAVIPSAADLRPGIAALRAGRAAAPRPAAAPVATGRPRLPLTVVARAGMRETA